MLESNDLNKFQRKFATIVKAIPIKQTKQKARKEVKTKKLDEELAKVVQVAERRVYRPNIKTKHWESESPSSEVVFKKDFTLFDEAWKAGYPLLVKTVIAHMEQKHPNMKLYIGIEYTVIKQTIDLEDNDPDEINMKQVGDPKPGAARTKPVNIYTVESIKPTIKGLRGELERKLYKSLDSLVGSNWSIKRITNLFANTHTLKAGRGSSYLPSPPKYSNAKCGLINIRNEDQECFRYCMLYHQSPQLERSSKLTVLKRR